MIQIVVRLLQIQTTIILTQIFQEHILRYEITLPQMVKLIHFGNQMIDYTGIANDQVNTSQQKMR